MGGTLQLDEVGEVSPGMQVKLLRALQEREIRRVGENRSRKVDVRLLAATNRDLPAGVTGGGFRQGLSYRLKVVEPRVPSLRERQEDVLPLARAFLTAAAQRMKRPLSGLAPAAALPEGGAPGHHAPGLRREGEPAAHWIRRARLEAGAPGLVGERLRRAAGRNGMCLQLRAGMLQRSDWAWSAVGQAAEPLSWGS